MDAVDVGRAKFLELLRAVDPAVQATIPAYPTEGRFLIALTRKGIVRTISVTEDDLIDIVEDDLIRQSVEGQIREAIELLRKR
jgi:hypothetical protein